MTRPAVRHLVPLLLLAVAVAGCGDDSTGGAGGGDAYSEDPVLGTEHDGACETVSAFTAQCEAEGGIHTDICNYDTCQAGGRCAEAPPALQEGQFLCGGVEVCGADQLCIETTPLAVGCRDHQCAAIPAECAETPTCACLLENTEPAGTAFARSCSDAEGPVVDAE